ncbi:PH domain-containing protein [Phreatobacter sp. HK31-P]
MPQFPDAPLIARFDRKRSERNAYLLVALLAVAALIGGWNASIGEFTFGAILIGCILAAVHFGQRKLQTATGPQLVIDSTGMTIPGQFAERIPWEAIAGVRIVKRLEHADLVLVDVPTAENFGRREQGWDHFPWSPARSSEITVNTRDLDVGSPEIMAAVGRFAPQLKA